MAEKVGGFELFGLEEFKKDLQKVATKYPKETSKEIYRLAGLFTKDVNANMHFKEGSGDSIKKAWHRKRQKDSGGSVEAVEVWNEGRTFHLLEHGHKVRLDPQHFAAHAAGKLDSSKRKRRSKRGKNNPRLQYRGWAPGLHFTEQTRNEWQHKYPDHILAFLNKMLKAENL